MFVTLKGGGDGRKEAKETTNYGKSNKMSKREKEKGRKKGAKDGR